VWLQTENDSTDQNPNGFGKPISWYSWNGTTWVPFNSVVFSGPTISRPASPVAYQQFYDTDINALIWFERGQWRTVDGIPGDLKFVATPLLADALTQNPGWQYFSSSSTNTRGRALVPATQDPGASPAAVFPPDTGVNPVVSQSTFGETSKVQLQPASLTTLPASVGLWLLLKL
jgi:hypothetical protein